MPGAAGVDDCQPAMSEGYAAPGIIDHFRSPNSFVVAAAVLNALQHRAHMPLWI
jgi:hypothetical protein